MRRPAWGEVERPAFTRDTQCPGLRRCRSAAGRILNHLRLLEQPTHPGEPLLLKRARLCSRCDGKLVLSFRFDHQHGPTVVGAADGQKAVTSAVVGSALYALDSGLAHMGSGDVEAGGGQVDL